ncbi:MAG TPA: hypothetical protein ENJ27_00595 [Candidatus Moranbacteria bacterium]|nr:hypothetical protein [Candidatus Moranbacteria bacterium]
MIVKKNMFSKKIILALIIVFVFVVSVNSVLAVTCPDTVNWDNSSGVCIPINTGLPNAGGSEDPITTIAMNVMLWLLRVVGVIAIIAFVISGIQYLTSAGSEDQITTAKRNMLWSIVGVIVALSGLIILNFVFDMFNIGGSGIGSFGGGGTSSAPASSSTSSGTTYINPDAGLLYNNVPVTSAERGADIVNSAINNSATNDSATTVPNSPLNNTGLPIAN